MSDSMDGDHRRASDYTLQPCPWPHGMEVEWPDPDGSIRIVTILSGSPVAEMAWRRDGHVLCSIIRPDGEEGVFLAEASVIRDAIKAMKERG